MYQLTFSYYSTELPISVTLLDTAGEIISAATVKESFHKSDWHCYLVLLENGFQGFIEFANASNTPALFAINPQEFETAPVQGAGDTEITITVRQTSGAVVEGAAVYVTNDTSGINVIAGRKYTNAYGQVSFNLNNGTYYVWREHDSFTFNNPRTVIV